MATNLREVCWEIYVNGEYYCSDSRWVPDEDVDVELEITNAVYDLIGIDPANSQIHVEVQAVTDDDAMSVGYSALEGTVVQLDVKNDAIVCECGAKEKKLEGLADPAGPSPEVAGSSSGRDASPETPENCPTESTKSWKNSIGGFFKWLFWMDPAVPEPVCVADASPSEPTSDLDLVDTEKSSVPEPEPELDLVDPGESSDSDPEPELDGYDADESSVPDPNSSKPLGQGGMDASSGTPEENSPKKSTKVKKKKKKKISAFLKKLFTEDLVIPEEPSDPEPEPDLDLAVADESSVPAQSSSEPLESTKLKKKKKKKISAFLKKLFTEDLVIPEEPSDPEPEPELDLGDPEKPSDPEQASEMDPHYSEQSVHTDSSFLYPDLHVVDSCYLLQLLQEPESFWYLFDSDDSCVPGPSSFVPKTFKQDPFNECFQLEELVKGCTVPYKDVTQVWTNIFIGNEEIARDRMRLKELGITHILNAAAVKKKLRILLGMPWEKDLRDTVNTGASYYRGMKISYCGLPTTRGSNISKYFLPAAEFIHKARQNSENKVFIHCTDGVSNAPALFLAYLMIHQYKTLENAIDYLINVRYIEPETEFLRQLAVLNTELEMNYH